MTTITRDDDIRKFYSLPVGRFNQLTTFEESLLENHSFWYLDGDEGDDGGGNIGDLLKKYENEPLKILPYVEETTKLLKKEPSKKSAKKPSSALIIPSASISKK